MKKLIFILFALIISSCQKAEIEMKIIPVSIKTNCTAHIYKIALSTTKTR